MLLTFCAVAFAAETETEIQLAYWQAAAKATAAQAAFRNSLSDQQKQMEAQRDNFGAQAEAARKKMVSQCDAKKQTLDPDTFTCVEPKKETPAK
jgi:hypothetical protein